MTGELFEWTIPEIVEGSYELDHVDYVVSDREIVNYIDFDGRDTFYFDSRNFAE